VIGQVITAAILGQDVRAAAAVAERRLTEILAATENR
jgi:hypothetical protein